MICRFVLKEEWKLKLAFNFCRLRNSTKRHWKRTLQYLIMMELMMIWKLKLLSQKPRIGNNVRYFTLWVLDIRLKSWISILFSNFELFTFSWVCLTWVMCKELVSWMNLLVNLLSIIDCWWLGVRSIWTLSVDLSITVALIPSVLNSNIFFR